MMAFICGFLIGGAVIVLSYANNDKVQIIKRGDDGIKYTTIKGELYVLEPATPKKK